ncbi:hypothetical protein E3P94_00805 [Wallemia ichthyophaga]|nr:hypothetical protein E3P95_00673 [Wallemia ichthyophaga]TIB03977.1 hypothetical protein E3P94_00805 [Wallemia ichthyophaga]
MDNETVEVGSTFPAPPSFYKYFTQHNLDLVDSVPADIPPTTDGFREWYKEQCGDDIGVDLRYTLSKPRVDWIVEDGYYSAYGEIWPLKESLPSLKDSGVKQLYPDDMTDKRPALHALLRTILITHLDITKELTAPPPPINADPLSRLRDKIEHIRLTGINMHHIINELRPMQARETLSHLQQQQQDKRKAKTEEIKAKHQEIRDKMAEIQQSSAAVIERVTKRVKESQVHCNHADNQMDVDKDKANVSHQQLLLELINDL